MQGPTPQSGALSAAQLDGYQPGLHHLGTRLEGGGQSIHHQLPTCGAIMQTAKDPGVTLLRSRFKTDLTKWLLQHGGPIAPRYPWYELSHWKACRDSTMFLELVSVMFHLGYGKPHYS